MLEEKEIKEIFEKLGLLNESERQKVLCQGKLSSETEQEPAYHIVLDNVTSSEKEESKSARLE
jgi:hypothetical protein